MITIKDLKQLLLLISCIIAADITHADQEEYCLSGQYLLSVSGSIGKQQLAVSMLEDASLTEMQIAERLPTAVLVEDIEAVLSDKTGELIDSEEGNQPCKDLQQSQRFAKQKAARDGRPYINYNFRCDCNSELKAFITPNDTYRSLQWGLNQIDAYSAWNKTTGSKEIKVAIIDSGIDYNHSDLKANMWRNGAEIVGDGVDNDGNGVVDDIYGYNAINNSGNPFDDNGHGTHCAGVIGAATNNSLGISGVNWQIEMIGVKFLNSEGKGTTWDSIKAVEYVTNLKNRGVNIVASNNSWGGGSYSQALYDAIARARNAGIAFIAAAGNETNNNDSNPSYPASYNVSNIVSVAAVDSNGNKASFSNYGANSVDIAAPGVQIASTYPNNQYYYMSGTSMAAPHVSAAYALLSSYSYQLSLSDKIALLYSSASNNPALTNLVSNSRMLHLNNLLSAAPNNQIPPGGGSTPTPTPTIAPPTPTPTATPTPTPTATPTATPTPTPTSYYNLSINVFAPDGVTKLSGVKVEFAGLTLYTSDTGNVNFKSIVGLIDYTLKLSKSDYTFAEAQTVNLNANRVINITASAKSYPLKVYLWTELKSLVSGALVNAGQHGSCTTNTEGYCIINVPANTTYEYQVVAPSGYRVHSASSSGVMYGPIESVRIASRD